MGRPRKVRSEVLTDLELQVMNVLWELADATVADIRQVLEEDTLRTYAYTTVSTMLRVLEKKGFVTSSKEGRGHRYYPAVAQRDYQTTALGLVVDQVFSGSAEGLVRHLLKSKNLSEDELNEIRDMLGGEL